MQAGGVVVTPTQTKILSALASGPLTYYDLMAKVKVREFTINRAVLALLDLGKIVEVEIGQSVGLELNESKSNQH